jgi:hypothetical protein
MKKNKKMHHLFEEEKEKQIKLKMEEKTYKENHINVSKILNLREMYFFQMFCKNDWVQFIGF